MKARRYHISLTALLVSAMLSSAALAIPEQSPKTNFGPRKKKLTVALLKETYGKPFYHFEYEEEVSAKVVFESPKTVGKIWHYEAIAFKIDDFIVVYYFAEGKFLARVIKGGPPDGELPEILPYQKKLFTPTFQRN